MFDEKTIKIMNYQQSSASKKQIPYALEESQQLQIGRSIAAVSNPQLRQKKKY
jgi:hypothetical protein